MPRWWEQRPTLHRFVADLLADELARARRCALPVPLPWPESLRLDEDLGIDSLERMVLATALAEALHLHESGIEDYLLARRTLGEWIDIAVAGLERFDARLSFRTSGTTGAPKACQHALATLRQETAHLATLFPQRRRILSAVPAHHIYGFLFTVLLPRVLGLEEEVVDLRASTPAWLARSARPGDLVVAHPDYWALVARLAPALPPDVVGVTSTAPCPDAVADAVLATGLSRLVQVYGSTETAGIGARVSHREPYHLFPYWELDALRPPAILRTLPDGGGQQAFPLQDTLLPVDARRFHIGSRLDRAVQVGGINVFPGRVREVLCRHPAVQDAAVRLMRPEEGLRLKAFVVPKPGTLPAADLQPALRAWIARELTAPERPQAIRVGVQLPLAVGGKPGDWSVAEGA